VRRLLVTANVVPSSPTLCHPDDDCTGNQKSYEWTQQGLFLFVKIRNVGKKMKADSFNPIFLRLEAEERRVARCVHVSGAILLMYAGCSVCGWCVSLSLTMKTAPPCAGEALKTGICF
jgi:hypothetical protein